MIYFLILVFERHLPNVLKFVDALPADARLVLDHFGKPRDFASWKRLVGELAQRENVYCKLSGLVTEVGKIDFSPYLETALEAFGPARLMFGSDWRVIKELWNREHSLDPASVAVEYAFRIGFDAVALNTSNPARVVQNGRYADHRSPEGFWSALEL